MNPHLTPKPAPRQALGLGGDHVLLTGALVELRDALDGHVVGPKWLQGLGFRGLGV